jgi:aerobic-type carbon monoxide dehydrogenase small subunit (CoxS/CutS family)
MQTLGVTAAAETLSGPADAEQKNRAEALEPRLLGPGPIQVTLRVNGRALVAKIDPVTTLLEALRIDLGLTGTKEVCDRGACGGCSVLADGRLVASCMMLAVDAVGSEITTIEGLARGERLDPIQASFIRHDALQCGYCTPGLIMAAKALLDENPRPTLDQIKRGLSGNLCRCGTYTNVFNAVLDASGQAPVPDIERGRS